MLKGKVKYLNKTDKEIKNMNSVKSDFIDDEIYISALEDSQKLKEKMERINEETPFFNQLGKDLFNSMYKIAPEVYDKNNLYKSLHMENDVLNELINNEKFEELRNNTCGDIFNSTLALKMFQQEAYEIIQNWIEESKENEEKMDKINEAIEKQNELQSLLESIENGEENSSSMLEELMKEIEQLNENIDMDGGVNASLTDALNKTAKEVKNVDNALNDLGLGSGAGNGNGSPTGKATSFETKKELANLLSKSNKFKKVCEELGRVKECLGKTGKKPSKYGQTICDIGTGDNLKKILSSEKVKLIDNDLENDFYKRYLDKNLLEYKTQGLDETHGPIVVCMDVSGSMSGRYEIWAKAVAIASLQLAVSQKRSFRCIAFNSRVTLVVDAHKKNDILTTSYKVAETEVYGGTVYEGALERALTSIEESSFKKADILFITDGSPNNYLTPRFLDRFNKTKENKSFKVQSILITSSVEVSDYETKYLKEFSDDIIPLQDLNNKESLSNIFDKMKFSPDVEKD